MRVLCGGCFDPLHYGHLIHFEEAKKFGDELWVAVTKDAFVNKGPGRPVFPEYERLCMVASLMVVYRAVLVESAIQALEWVTPNVYVKGCEYIGQLPEEEYCLRHGIRIAYTDGKTYSSTKLLHYYESGRLQGV